MSEDRLTQDCYLWFHKKYPMYRGCLFHVPNGGNRNAREGKKFKTMGVWPGVSDFLFLFNGKTYCIELKVGEGKQSPRQRKWEELVNKHNFKYTIVWNQLEFEQLINSITSKYL